MLALKDNIAKFESVHGKIKNDGGGNTMPLNFGPKGQA
jgi:hypothetical protein